MKFKIEVTQLVEIELDESKFTKEFMEEYNSYITYHGSLSDHAKHIAWLQATGRVDIEMSPEFIEGYGPSNEMGIKAKVIDENIYEY